MHQDCTADDREDGAPDDDDEDDGDIDGEGSANGVLDVLMAGAEFSQACQPGKCDVFVQTPG